MHVRFKPVQYAYNIRTAFISSYLSACSASLASSINSSLSSVSLAAALCSLMVVVQGLEKFVTASLWGACSYYYRVVFRYIRSGQPQSQPVFRVVYGAATPCMYLRAHVADSLTDSSPLPDLKGEGNHHRTHYSTSPVDQTSVKTNEWSTKNSEQASQKNNDPGCG